MRYTTNFRLVAPVNNFTEAYNYLTEYDMTVYAKEDEECSKFADALKCIRWELKDEMKGYIEVITNREMTEEELDSISSWISGQCSDGLGEGFEQQPFASYSESEFFGYFDDTDDEYYDDDWVMASFDWNTNNYKLKKVG